MNRLEPVAYIGYRPANDDAHGVVHIGLTHLIFDINRNFLLLKSGFHIG